MTEEEKWRAEFEELGPAEVRRLINVFYWREGAAQGCPAMAARVPKRRTYQGQDAPLGDFRGGCRWRNYHPDRATADISLLCEARC